MAVVGWFYRSFANSFTVCLIVSFVLQALLTVSCSFFVSDKAGRQGGGLTANSETNNHCFKPVYPPTCAPQASKGEKNGVAESNKQQTAMRAAQAR